MAAENSGWPIHTLGHQPISLHLLTMQNALIYCRVSTEEQADKGLSLGVQEKLCQSHAKSNGLRVIAVYRDEGKSGTTLDRPALKDLLIKCKEDKSIGAVIVQETDRLARNTKDHLTIRAILRKAGVKLISVAQPMLDDSPEGNMIDTILASVNQFQSDISGRKVRRALQEKFNQGWWPGWAPLGYLNVTIGDDGDDQKARRIIVKDPQRWHLIQEAFKLYLTGNYSADEVNDILYRKGLRSKSGTKVPHSIMVRTLKSPFYVGLMVWKGQRKMGKHPPMISLPEHHRVLEIMDAHNLHACRRRKHIFLLRGFVFCNMCGQRYTAERHPKKNKDYYHCASKGKHSNRGQNVEASVLEDQVAEQFRRIQFSDKFAGLVTKKLQALYQEQRGTIDSQRHVLENRKNAIQAKRAKAEEKLLSGVLSDDDFVRLRTKFREELEGIQTRIAELDSQKDYDIDVIQQILRLSRNIYQAYKTAPYELKRQYLGLFWDRFLVQDKRIVRAISTKLIQVLQKENLVIIRGNWRGSSPLIITITDWPYMATLKEKLSQIRKTQKNQNFPNLATAC